MFRTALLWVSGTVTAASASLLVAVAPADAALPAFTTTAKVATAPTSTPAVINGLRVGRHDGFDRLVFDLSGATGYDVRYVTSVVQDASGQPVTLQGHAFLRVVLRPTSTSVHAPQGTITPLLPELRQIKGAGDVEGVTSYGIGLQSRNGFRVFRLSDPSRLAIDVSTG
jgi:hypothetical protein